MSVNVSANMAESEVDDMVELEEISEKAIAANLCTRLKKETIYVSILFDPFP